jgi:serine/threonine protein kinase
LLGALGHIHAGGVVHRDVKPANVLIGPDGRARLTDFGIARHEDASTLTQAGQVVGTLAYMAPEIQRGDPATPRSDLYSLGVLLRACGGDREPSLVPLIERLSARDPAGRPASAAQALTILANTGATPAEPDTDATQPLAATEPTAALTSGPPAGARGSGATEGSARGRSSPRSRCSARSLSR